MARKVFISVLGTGFYKPCIYGDTGITTRFIQETTLLSIGAKEWSIDDTGIVLLTSLARTSNWEVADNKRKDPKTNATEDYYGLKLRIEGLQLPFQVQEKDIPDGKNEDEMWTIFTTLFNALQDGDELYIDLTHAFRYLPMLVLVLTNYAKFLKGVTVKSITYGNYEARDGDHAPIVDLLPIVALQDWTHAAAALTRHGDAGAIKDIVKQQGLAENEDALNDLVNNLVAVTAEIQTCRGTSILDATNIKEMMASLRQLQSTMPKPMTPIIEKISESFNQYNTEFDVNNGWLAAQWALQHNLLQQAATILQENAVSYFCIRHNIPFNDEYRRDRVNKAAFIAFNHTPKENWRCNSEKEIQRIEKLLSDEKLTSPLFLNTFNNLTTFRNDLNHFGMRKDPKSWDEIKGAIEKAYADLIALLTE